MSKVICSICGSEIPEEENEPLTYQYGYFSKRDGDVLEVHACECCLERLTQMIISMCQVNPIVEFGSKFENYEPEPEGEIIFLGYLNN